MMRNFSKRLAALTPVLAMVVGGAAGGAASAGSGGAAGAGASGGDEHPRALALSVFEEEGSVAVELIAQSQIEQQVEYELELIGNSRSLHRGNTSIPAGDRRVLSRLKTGYSDTWCVTVAVTESDGTSYTLTAGDCARA
jgi:hypothetical protein